MICILEIKRWKDLNPWQKAWTWGSRFHLRQTQAYSPWGTYTVLQVCDRKIPWEELARYVREEKAHLLLPQGITPPPDFPVPDTAGVCESLLRSTVLHLLKGIATPIPRRRVILADRGAKRLDWLWDWLYVCPVLQVVSEEEESCAHLAQQMLEEYGAPLLHSRTLSAKGGILVDPDGWLRPWRGFGGMILTASDQPGKGICVVASIPMTQGWNPPEGIALSDFLVGCILEKQVKEEALLTKGKQNGVFLNWRELLQKAEEGEEQI